MELLSVNLKFQSQARKSTVGKHTLVSNKSTMLKVMSEIMLIAYNIVLDKCKRYNSRHNSAKYFSYDIQRENCHYKI